MLVAATGVGAGDLATAAFTGHQLGVGIVWAVLLGAALKFVLNEGLTRWQLVTGQTLLEGAMLRLGWSAKIIFAIYFVLWSYFVGSALISACGAAGHAIFPVFADAITGKRAFGIAHSLAGLVLVFVGGFRLFESLMRVAISVMFVTVVATAVCIAPDWMAVGKGLVIPQIPPTADGTGLDWTLALIGGVGGTLTILCYGYWIREKGREDIAALPACRIDLAVAYGFTAIFGIAMVIIGSTIHIEGRGAQLIVVLADRLGDILGSTGRWLLLAGIWAALFSSLLGVWQAVPYLFADFWQLLRHNEPAKVNTQNRSYRGYLLLLATVPMLGLFRDFKQVQLIYSIFGSFFLPLLALVLLILNGQVAWVGKYRNRPVTIGLLLATLAIFLVIAAPKTWVAARLFLG